MFDPMKVAELKKLGFTDDDILGLQAQAEATEKSADMMNVAFKADPNAVDIPTEVDDALLALYESLGSDWGAVIARLSAPVVEQKRIDVAYAPAGEDGLLGQKKKAIEVPRALEQPMIDAYRRVGGDWRAVIALLNVTSKTYQAVTKQAQQEHERMDATRTKAAKSDPFAIVMQGGHEADLIPR